ncbi:unnamed protein product [Adineta ricciae]|uniref:Uncharacterized protein n=1 Tax=Adineta ricciae TaxID=249248 RepID=A0A815AWX8_ADIRI|nr:unnamed protein product [Adineta ricciae]CAF1364410.1 unnamed protein product [Adineta ricciae]
MEPVTTNEMKHRHIPDNNRSHNDNRNAPEPEIRVENPNDGALSGLSKGSIISIVLFVVGCFIYLAPKDVSCSMENAENRDFERYYGLGGQTNPFTKATADDCQSDIIYRPALPQGILQSDNSASSFLTLAPYGTGKTLIRCKYNQTLSPTKYFPVLILNKQISGYLETFVKKIETNTTVCREKNCLKDWTENEYGQLLLSSLVTRFIEVFPKMSNTELQPLFELSIEKQMRLITTIISYYSAVGTVELETFVNRILGTKYKTNEIQHQYMEKGVAYNEKLYTHFINEANRLLALDPNPTRIRLLYGVIAGQQVKNQFENIQLEENIFNDLRELTLFFRDKLHRIPVFIIDGIDENEYFFQNNKPNKDSLEAFCRTSVSNQIITQVMANNFHLSMFYPKIGDFKIEDAIGRVDKFPVYEIKWTKNSLFNYADYVLRHMNEKASYDRCKSLPNFETLVNYSDKSIPKYIDRLKTPRMLHYFIQELIIQMNNDARHASKPFIATVENVVHAYANAEKRFVKN